MEYIHLIQRCLEVCQASEIANGKPLCIKFANCFLVVLLKFFFYIERVIHSQIKATHGQNQECGSCRVAICCESFMPNHKVSLASPINKYIYNSYKVFFVIFYIF